MTVTILDQDIYVDIIDDDTITATVVDNNPGPYAATQGQVDAGTATTVYVNPATLQGRVDTDGTMAANSDVKIPSQKAVRTYVAANGGGGGGNTRSLTATTATTLTPDIDSYDLFEFTALASALTVNAPTGTPVNGNAFVIRITDNGTTRAITWNAIYRQVSSTLVANTTPGTVYYLAFVYNSDDIKWDYIGNGSDVIIGPGTVNEITYFNTANTIASLPVATYPSLTELSYLKGVTSAVQTQINATNYVKNLTNNVAGRYITAPATFGATAAFVNTVIYVPIKIEFPCSLDSVIFQNTTGTTGNIRIGIYDDTGKATPRTLLVDSGNIAISSAAIHTNALVLASFGPGLYWVAFNTDTASTFFTYGSVVGNGISQILGFSSSSLSVGYTSISESLAFGALPATATPGNYLSTNGSVVIGLRLTAL